LAVKRTKLSIQVPSDDEDSDELDGVDAGDPEEEGPILSGQLVKKFIRMWPRSIFSTPVGDGRRGMIASTIPELKMPGVYILYRDDVPFYVGQAKGKLRSRLRGHANNVGPLRSYFWNYFSAFVVENPGHIAEVEAILISAMPSVITNSSTPKFVRAKMEEPLRKLVRRQREQGLY
jgi:hypothetical protein